MIFPFIVLLTLSLSEVYGGPVRGMERYTQDPALTRFRRYLQIDTSKESNLILILYEDLLQGSRRNHASPIADLRALNCWPKADVNINKAVEYMRQQAVELGLPFNVFTPAGLPVCVITVLGSDPSLPSIMLNSHMDVVPAIESEWTYPPFSAYMDDKGDIYARGTQDTKDLGCVYMEVVRRLKRENVMLKRNVHITLMPDEETGGFKGMKPFVKTEAFKAMNVGFGLDEGMPSLEDNTLYALYVDKRPWQIQVTVHGEGGHGSGMPDMTALDKLRRFLNVVNDYRERMKTISKTRDQNDFGSYTSVNMNIIAGGFAPNVIPTEFTTVVDMRLAVGTNIAEMEQLVKLWISEAGNGTKLTFIRRDDVAEPTSLDSTNPYWIAMKEAINDMNLNVIPVVSPATSDGLVMRNIGFPVVGFTGKLNTPARLHSKDEFINADTFLNEIDIYYNVVKKLANLK